MAHSLPLVRAYLRASTAEQDVHRARGALLAFADTHGQRIAGFYPENESGTKLNRPELFRLLNDSEPGDILLCEQVDRLSRLTEADWLKLRGIIQTKGLRIVSLDLPTSHEFMDGTGDETFAGRMKSAMNSMLLDMLAAIARKDYEDRVRRSREGIERARKIPGKYKGRIPDEKLHARIKACLAAGMAIRKTAVVCGCSKTTVQKTKLVMDKAAEAELDKAIAAA
jgi:DNA invertase Pin-like site-specific DNA recombinase